MALLGFPIAYWSADEGSGPLVDATGNGHDLADTSGSIPNGPGKIQTARDLELADTEYFLAADAPWNSLTGPFSMQAWVKLESIPAISTIAAKWLPAGSQRSWRFHHGQATNTFVFQISQDGSISGSNFASVAASNFRDTVEPPAIGTFYHIVIRWDGESIYISCNAVTNSTGHTEGILNSTADITIGGQGGGIDNWDGLIDEVGLWDYALTDAEVEWLYNDGMGRSWDDIVATRPEQGRLSAVIYDVDGTTKLGAIPLIARGRGHKEVNKIGAWSFEVPAPDAHNSILEVGQEVHLYYEGHGIRMRGIIEDLDWGIDENGNAVLTVSGGTLALELLYQSTYMNVGLDNVSQTTALDTILANADTAWAELITGGSYLNITRRLDNMSLWQAGLEVAETSYAYLRETATVRQLELKNTHTASGIIATNRQVALAPASTSKIAPIITVPRFTRDATKLYNRIVPMGKGVDGKLLDLSYSDRSSPYTIQSRTDEMPQVIESKMTGYGLSLGLPFYSMTTPIICSGKNRAVIVWVIQDVPANTNLEYIRVGGVLATIFAGPTTLGGREWRGYYVLNPPSTVALAVEIATSASGNGTVIAAIHSLANVYQTGNPIRGTASATGTSTTPSVAVGSNADDLVLDFMHIYGGSGPSAPGANQTELVEISSFGSTSRENGGASITMSWTITSQQWGIYAASIRPATTYYLEDATSVADYRRRVKHLNNVDFTSFLLSDLNLANSLYDYAAYFLQKHKDPTDFWEVEIGLPDTEADALLPGDSLRLLYSGEVQDTETTRRVWKSVDQVLIVSSIDEIWEQSTRRWRLALATDLREDYDPEAFFEYVAYVERLRNAALR